MCLGGWVGRKEKRERTKFARNLVKVVVDETEGFMCSRREDTSYDKADELRSASALGKYGTYYLIF